MNNEKLEKDSKPQRGKAGKLVLPPGWKPNPDTRDLPASTKLKELGIKDVTDQYIGKSFIIVGGSFSKPGQPAEREGTKRGEKEEHDGTEA